MIKNLAQPTAQIWACVRVVVILLTAWPDAHCTTQKAVQEESQWLTAAQRRQPKCELQWPMCVSGANLWQPTVFPPQVGIVDVRQWRDDVQGHQSLSPSICYHQLKLFNNLVPLESL